MMKKTTLHVTAALLVSLAMSACSKLPEYQPVDETQWLEQNWQPDMWNQFYHIAQGTEIMPYSWFLALEQPVVQLSRDVPLFKETSHLGRYGFLPDVPNPNNNPDGLPVGTRNLPTPTPAKSKPCLGSIVRHATQASLTSQQLSN